MFIYNELEEIGKPFFLQKKTPPKKQLDLKSIKIEKLPSCLMRWTLDLP